ncbi:hypothetical protein ABDB91_02340 [Desulfoscipio sp. XC116]|uniref:hypothetical protein n=1 Tax=Desulfoscipio sp. XC116 TaxID=3144975 RepID=UPI00325AE8BB
MILNSPVDQNADSDELSLIDIIFAAEDVPISAEDTVFIREALSLLMPQEQMVVRQRSWMDLLNGKRLGNWECSNL